MKCAGVREELSAYFDGELPAERLEAVAAHLDECSTCSAELASFRRMAELTGGPVPEVPTEQLWESIRDRLEATPGDAEAEPNRSERTSWRRASQRMMWVAALFTLALVAGWGLLSRPGRQHDEGAAIAEFRQVMDRYVELLDANPVEAEQYLLAKYPNRPLASGEADSTAIRYRPVVYRGLPEGYRVESAHVVNMPCCTCVQAICRRPDGAAFALFEHDDDQSATWFGGRSVSTVECCGKSCCVVELDRGLAATWKHERRYLTAVGLRDTKEMEQLVAWFSNRTQPVE